MVFWHEKNDEIGFKAIYRTLNLQMLKKCHFGPILFHKFKFIR